MPIKKLTIPKAELMGALIGTTALRYVREELRIKGITCYLWSDSKCVLAWLRTVNLDKLPRFVKNRVQEIQDDDLTFRYIPTKENPADMATRGVTPSELSTAELWWKGPDWLKQERAKWPEGDRSETEYTEDEILEEQVEQNACSIVKQEFGPVMESTKTKAWDRTVRVASHALSFIVAAKNKLKRLPERLISKREFQNLPEKLETEHDKITWAEILLLRQAQVDVSQEEIKRWDLKQDEIGLWRVHGRLGKLDNSKKPVYLPRKHPFTTTLLLEAHMKCGHFGVSYTLSQFRERFWIEKGWQTTKKLLKEECL